MSKIMDGSCDFNSSYVLCTPRKTLWGRGQCRDTRPQTISGDLEVRKWWAGDQVDCREDPKFSLIQIQNQSADTGFADVAKPLSCASLPFRGIIISRSLQFPFSFILQPSLHLYSSSPHILRTLGCVELCAKLLCLERCRTLRHFRLLQALVLGVIRVGVAIAAEMLRWWEENG